MSFFFAFTNLVVAQNSSFEAFKKAQQAEFDSFKKSQQAEFDAFSEKKESEVEAFKKAKEKEFDDFVSSKDSSVDVKNQQEEPFLKDVPYKDLKTSINGYSQTIGEVPIDLFLKKNSNDYLFKITEPVIAQTYIAGDFAIFSMLKNEGIDTMNRTFTFSKNVGKNVSLIKVIAIKK